MRIQYLNGPRFSRAILAASNRVVSKIDNLNRINVFPVADNDTGTNMALTMQSISRGLGSDSHYSIQKVGDIIAESALMGAQGNSGAILAQFFNVFSRHLDSHRKIFVNHFSRAARKAVNGSYEAISNPVEGTILSVMNSWVNALEFATSRSQDFVEILTHAFDEAKKSLAETPKMMKLLAKAGVVDAGAQGFIYMLEGVHRYIQSGDITQTSLPEDNIQVPAAMIQKSTEDIKYRYCTECLLTASNIKNKEISAILKKFGDSIIVAGSSEKSRIHIHTDTPDEVFEVLRTHGKVSHKKSDDMHAQHIAQFRTGDVERIALVTDSSCDLPEDIIAKHNIRVVPVRVNFGTDSFLDKVTMSTGEFYQYFQESHLHPTTSQPTPADFKSVYEEISRSHTHILSVHLSGAASGTLQSAQTVSRNIPDTAITTVDSLTTSVGLGLLVRCVAELMEEGKPYDELLRLTREMVKHVHIFVSIPDVTFLIKSGRVPLAKGLISRLLNIKPLLSIDEGGHIIPIAKSFGARRGQIKLLSLLDKKLSEYEEPRFAISHTRAPELADFYFRSISERYKTDDIYISEASPALGAHVGLGVGAVAFIGKPKN